MSAIDLQHLRDWVGKTHVDKDVLSSRHARLMAATLGLPQTELIAGAALPPLWHWLYFLEGMPPSELGRDGHPALGGFLPPVPLPNRMWAGGQLEFKHPLPLDADVEKRSTVIGVEHKVGRSGDLVFVTVRHEIMHAGAIAISENHDIVYKTATPTGAEKSTTAMPSPAHCEEFVPTSTTLFRYSALTFNGHRIHYDADYCRSVEGYTSQVIHGPLNATLLARFAEKVAGKRVMHFEYRGVKPALLGASLTLNALPEGDMLTLWVGLPDGSVSMLATARF